MFATVTLKEFYYSYRIYLQVVNATILQQVFVVEYVVQSQMCGDCHRREAKDYWKALVQIRQKVNSNDSNNKNNKNNNTTTIRIEVCGVRFQLVRFAKTFETPNVSFETSRRKLYANGNNNNNMTMTIMMAMTLILIKDNDSDKKKNNNSKNNNNKNNSSEIFFNFQDCFSVI